MHLFCQKILKYIDKSKYGVYNAERGCVSLGGRGSRYRVIRQSAVNNPQQGQGAQAQAQQQPAQQTLDQYLGPKGAPMNSVDAAKGANPHYAESLKNGDKKFTHNCQRCVWATELRRRGYNVEAKERTSDNSYALADPNVPNSFLNVAATPITLEKVGSMFFPARAVDIKNAILKHGEGARGMIIMNRRSSGHVCNWEVKNGKALIYDGQMNKRHTITDLKNSGFTTFRIGRMDDKDISDPLVRDFVKRS